MFQSVAPKGKASGIHVDARWFPLILQRWPDEQVVDADLESFIRTIDDVAKRAVAERTFYAVIVRGKTELHAGQRRRIGKWVREMPRELRERSAGSFVVISGPMQRGILTALKWIIPELKDVFPAESLEAAVGAAYAALAQRGVKAPAPIAEIARYVRGAEVTAE